jgi:transcriptional regulator with XRE-family HTH domain
MTITHGFQGKTGKQPPPKEVSTPGSRIRAARAYRQVLQKDLENQGVITVGHLSKIERGQREIGTMKAGNLTALAKALGVSIDYIVHGEEPAQQQPGAAA